MDHHRFGDWLSGRPSAGEWDDSTVETVWNWLNPSKVGGDWATDAQAQIELAGVKMAVEESDSASNASDEPW